MYSSVPTSGADLRVDALLGQLGSPSPWPRRSRSPSAPAGRRTVPTRMFDGFRSRWMIPFWCACCTAWQTGTNSSSRCRGRQLGLVAVLGDRHALDQFHHEVRAAASAVTPASNTLAMFGWSISASACRSCSKRASSARRVEAAADHLERHPPLHRLGLVGDPDLAHAALAELLAQLVPAGEDHVARDCLRVAQVLLRFAGGLVVGAVGREQLLDVGTQQVVRPAGVHQVQVPLGDGESSAPAGRCRFRAWKCLAFCPLPSPRGGLGWGVF